MNATITHIIDLRSWALLLALSVLWGGSFFFVEVALTAVTPLTVVALRVTLAAIVLWVFAICMRISVPKGWPAWRSLFAMGMLNNAIPFTLIVWGQTHLSSGLAAILNATTPLFTVIVASVLLADERATATKIIAVVVGFTGVVIIIGPNALTDFGDGGQTVAQLAVLGGAISYALAGVYGRRFKDWGVHPIAIAAGQVTMSAIMMLPLALATETPRQLLDASPVIWMAVIALAVLSTALAYVLYFHILATIGAVNLLLVTFLIPVSALLLGWLLLNESLHTSAIVGMGFIAIGLVIIDGRVMVRGAHPR